MLGVISKYKRDLTGSVGGAGTGLYIQKRTNIKNKGIKNKGKNENYENNYKENSITYDEKNLYVNLINIVVFYLQIVFMKY